MKYKDIDGNWKELSIKASDTLPIGSIIPYTSKTTPINWLPCNGQAVSRTDYADLFKIIGTQYGAGDGSTTFNLPDLNSYRVPIGYDAGEEQSSRMNLGTTGGEETHKLTIDEMPSHSHTTNTVFPFTAAGLKTCTPNSNSNSYSGIATDVVNNTGGSQPHNNMQPYVTTNYIIKAFQSAGVVAQVSNTKSESIKDTYSCDYINGLNTYSTEERVIGTWIDGKPIYRKVFTFVSLENSSDNVVGSINDISSLVAMNGWANIGGALNSLPHSDYRSVEWNIGLVFGWGNKNVVVRKGGFGTVVGDSCVIVEYTKITD